MTLFSQFLFLIVMFGYNFRVARMLVQEDFEQDPEKELFYFAYGSNMQGKKMKSLVKNATLRGPAVLKNYRLDFGTYVPYWNGAIATAAEEPGAEIWGVLWSMRAADAITFSSSHYNSSEFYKEYDVKVYTQNKGEYDAFTHIAKIQPRKLPPWMSLPEERQPSRTYLKVLVTAAIENQLPQHYINTLIGIPTNSNPAQQNLRRSFGKPISGDSLEDLKYQFQIKWMLK